MFGKRVNRSVTDVLAIPTSFISPGELSRKSGIFGRLADGDEMLNEHALRRRPIIRNRSDDRRGARLSGMAGERSCNLGTGFADIGDHRDAAFDVADGEFKQSLAFPDRKAHGFAGVHRKRQAFGAAA